MIRESHPPSFHWKEVPRRGGGWLPQRDEKKCETSVARIVIPSEPLDLHCAAEKTLRRFLRNDDLHTASHSSFPFLQEGSLDYARDDDTGKTLFQNCGEAATS